MDRLHGGYKDRADGDGGVQYSGHPNSGELVQSPDPLDSEPSKPQYVLERAVLPKMQQQVFPEPGVHRDPTEPLPEVSVQRLRRLVQEQQAGTASKTRNDKHTGLKYDADKPRTDLLDPEFLLGVSRVLGFGAAKYQADNWRGGISVRRLLGALLRHSFAMLQGEDNDPESGEPHWAHAGCCLMFLAWMLKNRPDMDDRYRVRDIG